MLLFLAFNPVLLGNIKEGTSFGNYLTPFTATLFIFAEGLVISLIGSYIVVRVLDMLLDARKHKIP